MKVETYYMNEFTGEVFTDRAKALASEQAEAERIEKEIEQNFKIIDKYCDNHSCSECAFNKKNEACILCKNRL